MLAKTFTVIIVSVFALTEKLTAGSEQLTATFIGNEAFKITDREVTLFTDFPYQSGAYGYMEYDEALVKRTPNSYCLFSHGHRDHFAAELVGQVGCCC